MNAPSESNQETRQQAEHTQPVVELQARKSEFADSVAHVVQLSTEMPADVVASGDDAVEIMELRTEAGSAETIRKAA